MKGTDDIDVPVEGGEYVKAAQDRTVPVMDADVFISLTHFKGHETTGFGGTIKNIGMGCGSRAGKTEQHSNGIAEQFRSTQMCYGCKPLSEANVPTADLYSMQKQPAKCTVDT